MFGWTINLLMDTQDLEVNERHKLQHLVWSSYDRINIRKVNRFDEFFSIGNDIVKWSGSIQSLHLYNHCFESNKLDVRDKKSSQFNDLVFNLEKPTTEYAITLIVSLKINEKIFSQCNLNDNKKLVLDITNEIKKIMGSDPLECFFSLGEEDLVIISLSNSVDKFMNLIARLRSLYFKYNDKSYAVCELTNSFLVQNHLEYTNNIECNNAYATLNIALKEGINEAEFLKEFNKEINKKRVKLSKSITVVGEYDIVVDLSNNGDNSELFDLYSEKDNINILNANSAFYKKYIKNSKTIWCIKTKSKPKYRRKHLNVNILNDKDIHCGNDYCKVNKEINDLLVELNNKAIENKDNIQYAYYNVIYFLKEASLTLNSTSNKQWKYIASEQIMAFIENYRNFSEAMENAEYSTEFESYIADLNELINDMRSSFYHINRSHELFYHIPTTSLHYSGSFNSILIAYYNFINLLLKLTFKKPHNKNTKQAKIVYLVYFGMTSKIQQKTYLSNYLDPNETKLVGFELPYTALYDIKKYLISLTHEIYHLVAPYDRRKRNITVEKLWTHYYIKEEFISIIRQYLNITKDSEIDRDLINMVEMFFYQENVLYKCKKEYSHLLSLKILNSYIIEETDIFSNIEIKEYFENLYSDFKTFCIDSNEIKNDSQVMDSCLVAKSELLKKIISTNNLVSPITNQVLYNNIRKQNIDTLVSNITESICDNFMCQMSFDKEKNPKEQYLVYMLNFFSERKINYQNNIDAKMRFALFIDYNKFDLNTSNLDPIVIDSLKKILNEYYECYNNYDRELINSIISTDDFLKLIVNCCRENDINEVLELIKSIKQNYIIDNSEKFEDYIRIITNLNLEFEIETPKSMQVVHKPQTYIKVLNEIESNIVMMNTRYARNLDDFLRIIKEAGENNNGRELWYRGICNYKYSIIPSLFVEIQKNNIEIPYCYQLALMQECYSSTKKYYKAFAKNETPVAARQSLMQHYGVPTNLLDFSTDPLSSLFWALNPSASKDKHDNCTAVVYIFDPYEYSEVVKYLKNHYNCKNSKLLSYVYPIHSHGSLDEEYIIQSTDDQNTFNLLNDYQKDIEITNVDDYNKIKYNKLPIPVVIPQKNDRIIAQSGTFLAYNLFPLPDKNNNDNPYSYISLDQIYNEYIKLCIEKRDEAEHSNFIQRVLIAPHCLNEIRYTLNMTFNYTIDSVYPDLENLLKDVKKRTYGYQK